MPPGKRPLRRSRNLRELDGDDFWSEIALDEMADRGLTHAARSGNKKEHAARMLIAAPPARLPEAVEEFARMNQGRSGESGSLGPEPERLADLYASSFLAAGPRGGAAFKNDESFLAWLRQMNEGNRQSGMTAMEVDEVVETPLSDVYAIATVTWAATFRKTGDEPIRFRISYLLRRTDHALKVAAYISHDDE